MKTSILLLFFFCLSIQAQITIGLEEGDRMKPLSVELMNDLKNDTLVVVTPEYLDLGIINTITSNTWSMGQSMAKSYDSLTIADLRNPNYFFIAIEPNLSSGSLSRGGIDLTVNGTNVGAGITATFYKIHLELFKIDQEELKQIDKSFSKNLLGVEYSAELNKAKQSLSRFFLHDYVGVVNDIYESVVDTKREELIADGLMNSADEKLELSDIHRLIYQKDYFHNLNEGYFKNILQLIASELSSNGVYSSAYLKPSMQKQVRELHSKTLYVPDYLSLRTKGVFDKVIQDENWLKSKLKKYDFDYKIIDSKKLSEMILQNQDIVYLRYYRNESWQQIEAVEAKTGNVIWSNQEKRSPFSAEIKKSHFKQLNRAVKR